jgi:RHS repeat-associated protein
VPIATSPGRAGFELGLEVSYDSGAGNGPFGIGWHLSTPSIARKTDKGLPRYADADDSDVFVLSGAEDLVPVRINDGSGTRPDAFDRGDYRVQRYRPRTEGLFARIERWTNRTTGDAHWRAITRDNVLNVYGRSPAARIADHERPERVFSWLLEETRDDRGNIARYTYKAEDSSGVDPGKASESNRFDPAGNGSPAFLATGQRYLKRIEYGNRVPVMDRDAPAPARDDPQGPVSSSNWLFEVVFDYGEHDEATPTPAEAKPWPVRQDPFSSFRSTFEIRTYRLCRRVLMFHRFAELGEVPCLVRSTDLKYDEGPVVSYLASVTQAGYKRASGASAYEKATLPPLDLGYVKPEVREELRTIDRASLEGIPRGVDGNTTQWVDLDGEGIAGVLIPTERAWFYKANLGGGKLGPPVMERQLPAPAELRGGAQQLTDLGGDGNLDLVRYTPPLSGYFERTPESAWSPFVALPNLPNIDWNAPNLRFLDLDGDGFPDVLITEHEAFVWYRSRAKEGFESAAFVTKPKDELKGPAVVFADGTETIQLADMSGDGLVDIVRVRNGEVCYWPNLGYGRFGRKVTLDQSPRFDTPDQFDPKRIRFADIDGSGTSDLVYLGRDGVRLYFNQSGNGLAQARRLESLPAVDSSASLNVVDLLGQGTACLVLSTPLSVGSPIVYAEILGWQREDGTVEHSKKPHVLETIVNNLGAETRIAYAPSTKFYLKDKADGKPWLTRLAFPVQVIERIERYDHVAKSKLVTRFSYHHGYFDGHEREFRGFACVEQWDAESFGGEKGKGLFPEIPYDLAPADADLNLPPVRTVTWFHTGAWLERERLELALSREYYGNDPAIHDPRAAEFFLPDTVFEVDVDATGNARQLSIREEREATRALRGSTLRQEVYAEDGTDAAKHPYSVSERNYQVRCIQRVVDDRHGVFFSYPLHTLNLHYERVANDPRIQHELVLKVDPFGNVACSAAIAYPRRKDMREREETTSHQQLKEQDRIWSTLTERGFVNRPGEDEWYRIGVPVETTTSEITGLPVPPRGVLSADDVLAKLATATEVPYEGAATGGVQRRIVERLRALYYREYSDLAAYRDDLLGPLPLGEITRHALPHQVYRQALTPDLATRVYGTRVTDAMLRDEGRYVQLDGAWWAPSGRAVFSPGAFFQAVEAVDPFGQRHLVRYDDYALLVLEAEDPAGNCVTSGLRDAAGTITRKGNDYRVLAPTLLCDPNRNRTGVEFDALGMVVMLWQMGREGTNEGDAPNLPGVVFKYNFDAWRQGNGPAFAHVATREVHRAGGDPFAQDGAPQRQGFQHARIYSDGSGREVMKKVQAEPGLVPIISADGRLARNPDGSPQRREKKIRWVGTGRTVFDNKGNPVKKYESFFSDTIDYEAEKDLIEWGVTPILRYDPIGRLIRTDQPNGTHALVVFASWKQETWDENDTVLKSEWFKKRAKPNPQDPEPSDPETRAAWLAARHADTPSIAHLDSLGRVFLTIADNGKDVSGSERKYPTRVALDVESNQVSITDARGILTLVQEFDILGRKVRATGADAGESRTLFDVADKPMRTWDPRGYAIRRTYDVLQRPTHTFVQKDGETEKLVERTVYGEGHPDAESRNLRKHAYQTYDGAGALTSARFDFRGNPTEILRRLAREYHDCPDWSLLGALASPSAVEAAANASLDPEVFTTTASFDAMNRLRSRITPDGSDTRPSYNEAGLLESVEVRIRAAAALTTFIENIDYNARGQRKSVQYGNQTTTRYEYDEETFRLVHQITTRAGSGTLQDLTHTYDPVGNIVAAQDAMSFGNQNLSASGSYEYDALYQLTRSEGREHPGQQPTNEDAAQLGLPPAAHPNDWQALRRYRETYDYDSAGNILEVSHQPTAPGPGGWTRRYQYPNDSNRLGATSVPGDLPGAFSAKYSYDAAGNITAMPHLPEMGWDYASRFQHAKKQVQAGEGPPNDVYFAYDGSGQRVRKLYEHGGVVDERIYLGGYELYRKRAASGGSVQLERQTLHVTDDQKRVALVETKTVDTSTPGFVASTRRRFQLENHLGSSTIEVDSTGAVISYEEYSPYGSTTFRAGDSGGDVSAKRYRYTGKERDEETGLYYHGARYYAAWLGRWASCDPRGIASEGNAYRYVRNCPIRLFDPNGTDGAEPGFWDRHGTRIVGGLQVLGGALEIVAGAAGVAAPTGVTQVLGGIAIVHGADTLSTGLTTLWTGQVQHTLTQQAATGAARGLGASESTAQAVGTGVDLAAGIVPSVGVGVLRAAATRGGVEATTQAAAHAAPEVAAQTGTHAAPEVAAQAGAHAAPEVAAQTGAHAAPEVAAQTGAHAAPQAAAQTGTHAAPQAAAQTGTHAAPQAAAQTGAHAAPQAAGGGTALARQLGRAGEVAAGIIKNTERIASATGTAKYRIPDVLDHAARIIGEVKNVGRLSFTNQLRDFAAYAAQHGYTFELTVRATTELSGPLQQAVAQGQIVLRFLP